MAKRVFLIVLDSMGIGGAPDAAAFGDEGSDTLAAIAAHPAFCCPTLQRLGLFNIAGVHAAPAAAHPQAAYARLIEASPGKDTTIGHWEIAGVESAQPLPTFPQGFPQPLIDAFRKATGCEVLCNRPYSGTQVLADYGARHLAGEGLIVYTSADSVFQVAAHEELVPVPTLYRYCEAARALLKGPWGVGRVIARPFVGDAQTGFRRTARRHDFSLPPPGATLLDYLCGAGLQVIAVGKINDIFAGQGVTRALRTADNAEGMARTLELAAQPFEGLCFVNLVDFDMVYGHRNDVAGYAAAMTAFDTQLAKLLPMLGEQDLLLITADHGCDPSTPSTDHSRECVPLLAFGAGVRPVDLGVRRSYAHIAATVQDYFGLPVRTAGASLLGEWTAPAG